MLIGYCFLQANFAGEFQLRFREKMRMRRYIEGVDMDDIVATRLWITTRMKSIDADVNINCSKSMREIVDIIESREKAILEELDIPEGEDEGNLLVDILSGQEKLAPHLWMAIMDSLVRHSILFIYFNLGIAYVGVILAE